MPKELNLNSLPVEVLKEIFSAFFKEYIPEDVLGKLPMKALYNLAAAWGDADDDTNDNLGES